MVGSSLDLLVFLFSTQGGDYEDQSYRFGCLQVLGAETEDPSMNDPKKN